MVESKVTIDDCVQYGNKTIFVALIFLLILAIGSISLTLIDGSNWVQRLKPALILFPVLIPILAALTQRARKKLGFDSKSSFARLMEQDEFRQRSFSRASRGALLFVLLLQIPLGFLVDSFFSSLGTVWMGYLTMLLGAIAFLSLFLYFEREVG